MYEELVKRLRDIAKSDSNIKSNYIGLTMLQAGDAIEELSKPKWIPVGERLPENGTHCLVTRYDYVTDTPFVDVLWFDNSFWNRLNSDDYAVTHWMPIPEPPKEEYK